MRLGYFLFKIANPIGVVGVVLVLFAYLFLQLDRMSQDSVAYSMLNVVGSVFILYSLVYYWNLASGIIEVAWLIISIYGLIKAFRLKHGKSMPG